MGNREKVSLRESRTECHNIQATYKLRIHLLTSYVYINVNTYFLTYVKYVKTIFEYYEHLPPTSAWWAEGKSLWEARRWIQWGTYTAHHGTVSEEDARKTSIKLPDGNKLYVTVFSDENTEMYLRMLRDHDNLVIQNGSVKAIEDANAVLRQAYSTYQTTKAVVNPSQASIALRVT